MVQRLQRLDERFGARAVVMSRADRRELERQASTGRQPEINPELERRGRAWAGPLVRPLRQQRALLAAYVASLLFATLCAIFGVLGHPSWGGVFFGISLPVIQEAKRRLLRPEVVVDMRVPCSTTWC